MRRRHSTTKTSAAPTTTTEDDMLKEPTIEKLAQMKLGAMANAWNEQHGKPDVNRLSFDECLGLLDVNFIHPSTTTTSPHQSPCLNVRGFGSSG